VTEVPPRPTPRGSRALGTLAVLAVLAGAAACSDDDSGPLGDDQLPGTVEKTTSSARGVPTVSSCEAVNNAQEKIAVSAAQEEDGYRYWTYRLDDGTWVSVAIVRPGYPFEDLDRALSSVSDAVEECAGQSSSDGGQVAALEGVPEGAVGFTSTTTSSSGTREGATVLATAGDDRIVTVAVSHDAGSDASVDVMELLDDVQDPAADLDLSG
jgi:hypothetical protein